MNHQNPSEREGPHRRRDSESRDSERRDLEHRDSEQDRSHDLESHFREAGEPFRSSRSLPLEAECSRSRPRVTCEQLDDYLDGDLSFEFSQSFEQHLESCVDCREAVEFANRSQRQLQAAWARINGVPSEEIREQLQELASVSGVGLADKDSCEVAGGASQPQHQANSRSQRWVFQVTALACCLGLVSVLTWTILNSSSRDRQQDQASGFRSQDENAQAGSSEPALALGNGMESGVGSGEDRNASGEASDALSHAGANNVPSVTVHSTDDSIGIPVIEEEDFTMVEVYQVEFISRSPQP